MDRFVDAAKRAIDGGDSSRLKRDLSKLKESKDELEQIHKLSEEERDKQNAREVSHSPSKFFLWIQIWSIRQILNFYCKC